MCLYAYFMWIYVYEYIFEMDAYIYFKYANFQKTCMLMRLDAYLRTHARIHYVASVYAQDAYITVLTFLQHMSTPVYVYPSVWNTRMEMGVWFVFQRYGLCVGLFYCFIDTVCFTCIRILRIFSIEIIQWTTVRPLLSTIFEPHWESGMAVCHFALGLLTWLKIIPF